MGQNSEKDSPNAQNSWGVVLGEFEKPELKFLTPMCVAGT